MNALAPAFAPHARDDTVTAVLGPTNTGKTHYAIERMLAHRNGIIGFPLRLLAREVYDRVVALRGPRRAALITGEEKIAPADAQYVLCTVESMPLDWGAEFLAVDEIQLCADADRGHVFTDRLLRARGLSETLFLGAETMRPRIAALIPKARFVTRPRFSTLSHTGARKISRLPPRSAVVGFSVESVYAIAELIRRQKGGAAVVMGSLSPRTRNAQVALFQNGDVDHLVATDAIGMGLNLDLDHVAFAGLRKFDGRRHRMLAPEELAQIAGRAGRHTADGSFGVTGEARPLDDEVAERIVTHRFDPVAKLQWRNARLEFGTVPALLGSLDLRPPHPDLLRAREADDVAALRHLWDDPATRDRARGGPAVRLLWDVCQVPDFRKTSPAEHAALLARIYGFLSDGAGVIPCDWIAEQVARVDRTDGDIDALSRRLAHVRTWTYIANRGRWLDDPGGWRERTRAVEDRLSDALHERLTKRFVDRRTSVLMKRLKQKERLLAEISESGEVVVEGHAVGQLEGFRFRPDPSAGADETRMLRSASLQALQTHFAHRADRFYNAPDTEIDVTEQGGLIWNGDAVGRLEPGSDQLSPGVRAFVEDDADPAVAEKVRRRLGHWIERRVKTLFEPLINLRDDPALTGLARGVAFQLVEGLGVLQRRAVADDVKALDQEGRALLRKHGVRFGQHHVFMPALLKPAPTRFRLLLWSLHSSFDDFPPAPPPGLVTIAQVPGAPEGFYTRAGYRLCGSRALRIDMLERLADMIRPLDARAGFEASADMLSITGCTLEQFAELMQGLGYAAERGERPKAARAAAVAQTGGTTGEEAEEAVAEAAPKAQLGAQDAAGAPQSPAEDERVEAAAADAEAPTEAAPVAGAPALKEAENEQGAPPPVEVEIFYSFTLAPRRGQRERGPQRRGKPRGAEAGRNDAGRQPDSAARAPAPAADSEPAPENAPRGRRRGDGREAQAGAERRDGRKPGKPGGAAARGDEGGKALAKGGRRNRDAKGDAPAGRASPPAPRERPADPDSPFAILKQLKDRL